MWFQINKSIFLHQNEGPDGFYEKTKNEYNYKKCTYATLYGNQSDTFSLFFFFKTATFRWLLVFRPREKI